MSIWKAAARMRDGSIGSMHRPRPRWRQPWSGWSRETFSGVKGVGAGVFEHRIDFGPGYRIYFGKDGDALVILLGGGTKRRQRQDIETARGHWRDYKRRKRQEG